MEAVEARMKREAAPPGPAGPSSSYIIFCKEFRLQPENKGLSVTEAGSLQGKRWREMSKVKKAKYLKLAQEDRERYNAEVEQYKATYGCTPPPKRAKKAAKNGKDPHLPRGPRSSYMFFCQDHRARNKGSGLSVTEAGAQQGREWRELSADKKAKFEAMAAEDRERYNREMGLYRSIFPDPASVKQPSKPPKKQKDPNAPKKPTSSYMFFNRTILPTLRAQNPELLVPQLGSMVGAMWRNLDPHERMQYDAMAAQDRARYEAEMLMYMGST